jgi:hypothetical protein
VSGGFLKPYIYIGGIFSVFYISVGLLLATGRMTLGMEPQMRFLVGAASMAYGAFRAFLFYKRYKASKEEENK